MYTPHVHLYCCIAIYIYILYIVHVLKKKVTSMSTKNRPVPKQNNGLRLAAEKNGFLNRGAGWLQGGNLCLWTNRKGWKGCRMDGFSPEQQVCTLETPGGFVEYGFPFKR